MSESKPRPRRKAAKNTYTTKSGTTITLNRSLTDRMKAGREARAQRRAAYLSTLPKEPWKRLLYRLHPKRLYQYWFSRDGAIMALKIAGICFVVGFLLVVGLFAYFRKDLPKIHDINSSGNSGGSIAYYDRTGQTLLFQDYDAFKRIPVASKDISPYMKEATIAVEDKDFYHEGAFNVKGITRAAINNATGGTTQGGSTITQQLVKLNEGWTNDHTVSRKVKELILAVELEREYSKDDILTAYLNLAPYSGLDNGVQAAAQDLFHTDASKLSLAQAAMLASIPKNPSRLSPYASVQFNPAATDNLFQQPSLIGRQQYVLDQMAKQGYVTQAQADAAKQVDVLAQVQQIPATHYAGIKFPYAVIGAREQLQRDFNAAFIKSGGWKVITTIDVNLQTLAEKAVADGAKQMAAQHADNAAFVAEDNATGQVVAMVGGTNFDNAYGRLNYATDVNISPGSSIKPYTYTTFINNNNNVGAGSVLYDSQGALPGYACTNKATPENGGNCLFDDTRKYSGPVTLRYALGSSLNVPAIKAFTTADPTDKTTTHVQSINKVISTADALMDNDDGYRCYKDGVDVSTAGMADETQCYAAAGIGDGAYLTLADHVNGIASIARMGQAIPQTMILKVTNASGKVLEQFKQPKPKQVVKADAAYITTNMADDPGASYLSGHCTATTCTGMKFHRYKGWDNAIKTGTTNDFYDGLMMSWNSKYTAGIWVGNHTRTVAYTGQPENMTDPIMAEFMKGAIDNLGNVKPTNWTQPTDIKTLPAFHSVVPFSTQSTPPSTDLFPSWYVGKTSSSSTQPTDKVSGLIATSCTPPLARQTGANTDSNQWNVDLYMGGSPSNNEAPSASSGGNAQATDNVHSCSDQLPTATITGVIANGISTSTNGSHTLTCPSTGCTILVHVEQGTHQLTDPAYPDNPGTLSLIVNGQAVQSQQVDETGDYQIVYTPPAGTSGSMQIVAQITDSVLYAKSSDPQSITVATTTSFRTPTTSGGTGGNGDGNNKVALGNLAHSRG